MYMNKNFKNRLNNLRSKYISSNIEEIEDTYDIIKISDLSNNLDLSNNVDLSNNEVLLNYILKLKDISYKNIVKYIFILIDNIVKIVDYVLYQDHNN